MKLRQQEIIEYYQKCNNAYRDAWGLDKNMQLNLGLWFKGTKKLSQALENLNKEIAKHAEVKAADLLLDAGCGVGGSAIFMAKNFGCKVIGISLVEEQIVKARENAINMQMEALTDFQQMDYNRSSFKDNSFDIIIGLESICYATSKMDFLKEAYRLLKKGGRLVLAENLQAKENLSVQEYDELYIKAFNGCKVESLESQANYLDYMAQAGFSSYQVMDYTEYIRPSIKRLRRFFYPAWLYNQYHAMIGKPFSETQLANTRMCYYLQTSLKKGLWSYAIIKAVK